MIIRPRILLLCASTLIVAALSANAPARQKQPEPTGSISGRVTVMGKAAANIPVLLLTADSLSQRQVIASAKTDAEGGFTLSNLPAGRYLLNPFAPAMADPATNTGQVGKMISLSEGESIDAANIELSRGGVITGRVMDSNNRPVIGEKVTLYLHNQEGRKHEFYRNYETSRTDDRGQYRIYGLPGGRYSVSAGVHIGQGSVRIGFGNVYYPRTFHPDTTDEAAATIVEVKPGGEATGVDITVGRIEKTYTATGRIVDAETGKPIADLPYGYGSVSEDGKYVGAYGSTGARSGAKGEFLIEGVAPARYVAMVAPWGLSDQQAEFYGDPAFFEIKDSDVSDLEIRVRRGASVSGTVIIEGVDEQTAAEKFKELSLYAQVQAERLRAPGNSIKVAPDGSFRATGLPPGKVSFHMGYPQIKGLMILRTEIEGAEQRGPFALCGGPAGCRGEAILRPRHWQGKDTGSTRGRAAAGRQLDRATCFSRCRATIPAPDSDETGA